MPTIRIYKRQDGKKLPRMTAAQFKKAKETLESQDVRVMRPSLLEFLLKGGFAKLPVTPQTLVDSPYKRPRENGWEVPLDSRGRKVKKVAKEIGKDLVKLSKKDLEVVSEMTSDLSTKESIRIWIDMNMNQFGITPEMVSVCIDD